MAEITNLYKRISLEFISQFPGQVYLRFEPHGKVPVIMVQVLPADMVAISQLADPYMDMIAEATDDDLQRGKS